MCYDVRTQFVGHNLIGLITHCQLDPKGVEHGISWIVFSVTKSEDIIFVISGWRDQFYRFYALVSRARKTRRNSNNSVHNPDTNSACNDISYGRKECAASLSEHKGKIQSRR
jgi:hypothetical protein